MCVDPVTAAITTAAAAAVTSAVEIKKTHDESKITQQQAKIQRDNAAVTMQEGIEESRRIKLNSILEMGKTKTQIASGNIMTESGTALNAVDTDKMNGDIEALSTLKSSFQTSKNYMTQADMLYKRASLSTENALYSGISNTINSGLNAYSKAQSKNKTL